MNNFLLQLGHPKIVSDPLADADSISIAVAELFRPLEESIYLFWYQIPIRIRYQQDLPKCFNDILAMVWLVQRDTEGATEVKLETQILSIQWEVRWSDDECRIHATFTERDELFQSFSAALNRLPDLETSRSGFLSEWKTLLHQIIVSIRSGHVEIRDGVERRKWEMLQQVEKRIVGHGEIYTRPA